MAYTANQNDITNPLDTVDRSTAAAEFRTLKTALNTISTVASATTPDIFATAAMTINYTGTTVCTGFVAAANAGQHERTLVCAGAAQFTASGNLLIDGTSSGSTLTVAAGTVFKVLAITATQFRMIQIYPIVVSHAATATDCTNALYAVGGKNALIATDTNLQTWADALPAVGAYQIGLTSAQGNLPIGSWYIYINRHPIDAVGTLYHSLTASTANTSSNANGTIYHNTCVAGAWSGWKCVTGSGSCTLTASVGLTTTPTGTANYCVNNGVVTVGIPSLSGTSNSVLFNFSGLPVNVRPSAVRTVSYGYGIDNGGICFIQALINTDGTIQFDKGGTVNSWTASGGKYNFACDISYRL